MLIVDVTQYVLPDGKKKIIKAAVSDELTSKYEEIKNSGCNLSVEVLTTGLVSLAIEDPIADGDCSIDVVNNSEAIATLERLISNFNPAKHAIFRSYYLDN